MDGEPSQCPLYLCNSTVSAVASIRGKQLGSWKTNVVCTNNKRLLREKHVLNKRGHGGGGVYNTQAVRELERRKSVPCGRLWTSGQEDKRTRGAKGQEGVAR